MSRFISAAAEECCNDYLRLEGQERASNQGRGVVSIINKTLKSKLAADHGPKSYLSRIPRLASEHTAQANRLRHVVRMMKTAICRRTEQEKENEGR